MSIKGNDNVIGTNVSGKVKRSAGSEVVIGKDDKLLLMLFGSSIQLDFYFEKFREALKILTKFRKSQE